MRNWRLIFELHRDFLCVKSRVWIKTINVIQHYFNAQVVTIHKQKFQENLNINVIFFTIQFFANRMEFSIFIIKKTDKPFFMKNSNYSFIYPFFSWNFFILQISTINILWTRNKFFFSFFPTKYCLNEFYFLPCLDVGGFY